MTRYPLKRLDAYSREDRDFFLGRDAEVPQRQELEHRIDQPWARALLEDLAKRDLIRIREVEEAPRQFSALLTKLRSYEAEAPTLEETTQEVAEGRHQMQFAGTNNQ